MIIAVYDKEREQGVESATCVIRMSVLDLGRGGGASIDCQCSPWFVCLRFILETTSSISSFVRSFVCSLIHMSRSYLAV